MRIVRPKFWPVVGAVLFMSGCLALRHHDDAPLDSSSRPINAADCYTLACPDLIEVIFFDRPEASRTARIAADGTVDLGKLGHPHVEGGTLAQAARHIADRLGLPPGRVRVQVVEYNSRQVLVYGEVNGEPRVVDYRGPETVVELLRRIGGIAPGAALNEISVLRASLSEGAPVEVLPVDLVAIIENGDQRTNFRIQPLDEIYVGELARSRISKSIPPVLRPIYDGIVDLLPTRTSSKPANSN